MDQPIVDSPADPPADPSTDETVVSDPVADDAEVPLVVDAGARAATSESGNGAAPGLALLGALLALGGYLVTRSAKTGGAHRR
jgi:Pyruvate/2-oxoacid:ferredoxin oxidoreductase gamma subunit